MCVCVCVCAPVGLYLKFEMSTRTFHLSGHFNMKRDMEKIQLSGKYR